ncbi:MAG: efflux RND transporter periplasmic adaptor subunit [Candidatus Nealsonbacteria bacterium]|nr:efflux RND transporter periplasmic adaptor subunit [Candidatus Nealsonbacteria bacterium]
MIARSLSVTLVLASIWSVPGCEQSTPKDPIRPVRAMTVGDEKALEGRAFPGLAKATQEVNLSFRVQGKLVELAVQVGTVVQKGDLLAKIDPQDYEVAFQSEQANLAKSQAEFDAMKEGARPEELAQLKASVQMAQAGYEKARSDFSRAAALIRSDAIAAATYERKRQLAVQMAAELRTAMEALRIGEVGARVEDIRAKEAEIASLTAAVRAASDRLGYTELRAPFAGEIAAKYVENFETVQAKQQIVRLLDISQIEMVIDIPETLISLAPYVKEVACRFKPLPDREVELIGKIKEISAEASETTRTYPVTVIMAQPDDVKILPGMAGIARAHGELPENLAKEGFVIPAAGLLPGENDKWFVWPIERTETSGKGKVAARKEVDRHELTTLGVRVTGLAKGQLIAIAGVHYLEEGREVRILGQSTEEEPK